MIAPFSTVLAHYERGRFLDAWAAGQEAGPLASWPAVEPLLLAGRLALRLGAARLARLLIARAHRACRDHPGAQYHRLMHVHERRGAFVAWRERCRLGRPGDDDANTLADYYGQCALLLGSLRDFPSAEEQLRLARAARPDRVYWHVERVHLFMLEDRHAEATAAAEAGLALRDCYLPSILSAAQCFLVMGRNDDALALLSRAAGEMQSGEVAALHVRVLLKGRRLDEAGAALDQLEALTPLKEPDMVSAVARQRAEIALRRRDYVAAMAHLNRVTHPFDAAIAANLRTCLVAGAAEPRRVELSVPFVAQHHRTCVPAVLTSISRFWGRPAEHVAVAEEICYDGTPSHSERKWADTHGWRTREFRVDWAAARALIDRGIPFTLTWRGAVAGHLQAVMGYDEATRVLLARDPATTETVEVNAAGLEEQQRAAGPRGMAMVPPERSALLDGLDLPEADLYDRYHALHLALEGHQRDRAVEIRERMAAIAPDHRLTLTALRALAAYDANPHQDRAAIEALLGRYPDDQALQLARLGSLRQVGSREERLAWLEQVAGRPGADPVLSVEYAVELSADERMLEAADWIVRRALRRRPDDAYALFQLGVLRWRSGRHAEAAELYRTAACVDEIREPYARGHFEACRWLGRHEEGLAFLRQRVDRLGARSSEPAVTLFAALETLDRTPEAFALLDDALRTRPDEGALQLFAAGKCAQYGRHDAATAHRAAAAGRVKHVGWLAEAARDARLRGDRRRALDLWREILVTQPLDLAAHFAAAQLLGEVGARQDAADHLRAQCAMFPHHAGLQRMLYQWTEGDPASLREPILRTLAAIDPADGWTQRELALNLLTQNRLEEALRTAEAGLDLDTASGAGQAVLGHIHEVAGRPAEADAWYRRAIARNADASAAILGLLDVCGDTLDRRKEALEYVTARLLEQAVYGDGLLALRRAARGVLTPAELLDALRRAHGKREDLWHAWSALIEHLTEMGLTDEALTLARAALARFPTVVPLYLDLARVHRARLEAAERVAVLERCRALDTEGTAVILELADAYVQAGRTPDAERLLEASAQRLPLAAPLRGQLAALLFQRGEQVRAIDALREALRIEPRYEWAWQRLAEWSSARGHATAALDLARGFAESRPGESQPWVQLADLQLSAQRFEGALASAERALQHNPRDLAGHDLRAAALAGLRRFSEAEDACRPAALGDPPPPSLRARAAWVDAQRGDLTSALARMRALLELHPDLTWGWRQVLEWSAARDQHREALQAAQRLSWLEVGNVVPIGWQGELKLRLGDVEGAEAAFRRAMQLQPDYLFAGFRIFDLQRQRLDLDGARRTLEILRPHAPREQIIAAEGALAVAANDQAASLATVRELCCRTDADGTVIASAAERLTAAGWGAQLERALQEATAGPAWHPIVPVAWARSRVRRARSAALHLRWLTGLGAPGKDAVCAMLEALGDQVKAAGGKSANVNWRVSWELLWIRAFCHGRWRGDDTYWGKFGYALLCRGRARAVIRWLRDWRGRRAVEPWMLQNLALALLVRRRDGEARAVLRHLAHAVVPVATLNPPAMIWCSIAACLDGELPLAERLLYATPEDAVAVGERALRRLATTVVEILREAPGRTALTRERRAVLEAARAAAPPRTAGARLVALATWKVARHTGDGWMTVKAWLRLHRLSTWLWWAGLLLLGARLLSVALQG